MREAVSFSTEWVHVEILSGLAVSSEFTKNTELANVLIVRVCVCVRVQDSYILFGISRHITDMFLESEVSNLILIGRVLFLGKP